MNKAIRWITGCAMTVLLCACHAPDSANGNKSVSGPMELKIYDVPPAKTDVLRGALSEALASDKAKVSMPAPGKLMVYASRDAQPSIEQAIADLSKSSPKDQTDERLQVRFLVVDTMPGDGADDPALKDVAGSLAVLRQSLGVAHFSLEEQSASVVDENIDAELKTGHARQFNFMARPASGESIELRLQYYDGTEQGIGHLSTTVSMQPGQYTILAQAPATCPDHNPKVFTEVLKCDAKPGLRLLIVRVDRMNPTT